MTAREEKPDFSSIPPLFLRRIEKILNDQVAQGETVYGSYSAAASFRITLSSGRVSFAKGAHPGDISHITQTLRQEIDAYETIPEVRALSPAFLGYLSDGDEDGWFLAFFDFIPQAPLQIAGRLQDLFLVLQKIHRAPKPPHLPRADKRNYVERVFKYEGGWKRIAEEARIREKFLSVFEDPAVAEDWFSSAEKTFLSLQEKSPMIGGAEGILHQDLRLDNVMADPCGKIYLIDWPNICCGPVVMDLAQIIPSLMHETGMRGEDLLALYTQVTGIDVDRASLDIALASQSGHLADAAYRAIPPKMPRLRQMQRSMLRHQLLWLQERGTIENTPNILT